ncbi:unnamed protein product, partial [Durusdinium trenchii]
MAELFDFELLDSAEDFVILGPDPMEQEVAAAETAQIAADQDEMAILADYVIPAEDPCGLGAGLGGYGERHHLSLLADPPWTGKSYFGSSPYGILRGGCGRIDGASCPDTEPRPDASSSSVPASGALSLLGKQLPPVPSSTLRTSLDTEVPVEQRLQDPVTYSFAEDGNILLTNVMAGLPCLPKKLAQPLRSIQVGEIVELCLKFDVSKLTPPAFARIVEGTLRIHCLGLEELIRMGFNQIPWDEAAVRALLNKLRDTE